MIYYIEGLPFITSSKIFIGPVIHSGIGNYQIEKNDLVELNDPNKICCTNKWIVVKGKAYQVYLLGPAYEYAHAELGNIYLADEMGQKLKAPSEIAYLVRKALPNMFFDNFVISDILDYQDLNGFTLFLANIETNEFIYREGLRLQNSILQSDGVYGFYNRSKSLKKLDLQLNDVWSFDPNPECVRPMTVILFRDLVLYYHGFTNVESLEEVPVPGQEDEVYNHGVRRDGELYCLDRETGDKRWERVFPYALNDMVLHEDKLYCVADKELYRLSAETGEVELQTQMEYSAGGDTELYKVASIIDNKLWISVNHWFYKTFCLLVVNLDTFDIEHKVDIPAPYAPDIFLYFDEEKRQVYYRLRLRYSEVNIEHSHHLLALNLDELDQPVSFEQRPEIDISLKPAEDNKDLEELWIHIKDTPLHKALRFGIIETQNQTNIYAEMNRYGEDCRKTFNGRVHFRYSGSDKPKDEVEKQLKVIESSFNDWAKQMDVEAGTGSEEPVSIDVAYIE